MSKTKTEELTVKDVYTLKLSEWDQDAILQIINNSNFQGKDLIPLAILTEKIKNLKKDK